MTTPEEMRVLQWEHGLTKKEAIIAREFLSDMGWNVERNYYPDWLVYLAQRMVVAGWTKTKQRPFEPDQTAE